MIKVLRKIKGMFDNFTVKSKLMVIIMMVTGLCTIFALISFTYLSVINIKEQMKANLSSTGLIVANRVNASLLFDNNAAAFETLNSLSLNKSIEHACIYNKDGSVFANYHSAKYVNSKCPKVEEASLYFTDKSLRLFNPITDQFDNQDIGYLFIESDLNPIYSYLTKQTIVGLSVIMIVLLFAYLLSLKLQKVISKPLHGLINKNFENNGFFTPSQEYLDSNNEISKIDMLMRAVMTRISYLEEQNAKSRKAYEDLIRNSESTFNYLADELKQPVEATIAFADIISSRAIGPVDDEYVSYYNDVYFTIFYYYGIINDSMKLFKEHLNQNTAQRELTNFSGLIESSFDHIKSSNPDFLQGIIFSARATISPDITNVVVDKIIVRELIYNAAFVFSKYLNFLQKNEMHMNVIAKVNDSEGEDGTFEIRIECQELQNESISEFLENHRKYQNDVHMLRSKLQFMKFLAKYDGGVLDFGTDLRTMDNMVIIFPLKQMSETSTQIGNNANFSLESLLKKEVQLTNN